MNGSVEMMSGMMGGVMPWMMGLTCLSVPILLVLAAAALIKYLFFNGRGGMVEDRLYD